MKFLIIIVILLSIFSCSEVNTKEDIITNDIVSLIEKYPEMWNIEYQSLVNNLSTYTYKVNDEIIIEIQIYYGSFEQKVSLSEPNHIKLNSENSYKIFNAIETWKLNKIIKRLDSVKHSKTEEQKPLNKQEDIFVKEKLLIIPEQK